MTKKQAKKLCLDVWEYLRDHPEIKFKPDLPEYLYEKIKYLEDACPLCEIFDDVKDIICPGCPLNGCIQGDSLYRQWFNARTNKTRAKYASAIVEKVKAWEV